MKVRVGTAGGYRPSESSNTVHGHTAAGLISKLHLQQVQPVINHLVRWSRAIIEGPVLGRGRDPSVMHSAYCYMDTHWTIDLKEFVLNIISPHVSPGLEFLLVPLASCHR